MTLRCLSERQGLTPFVAQKKCFVREIHVSRRRLRSRQRDRGVAERRARNGEPSTSTSSRDEVAGAATSWRWECSPDSRGDGRAARRDRRGDARRDSRRTRIGAREALLHVDEPLRRPAGARSPRVLSKKSRSSPSRHARAPRAPRRVLRAPEANPFQQPRLHRRLRAWTPIAKIEAWFRRSLSEAHIK